MQISIDTCWFVLLRVFMSLDRVTQCFLLRRFMDDIVYGVLGRVRTHCLIRKSKPFMFCTWRYRKPHFTCVSHVLSIVIGNVMIETCILAGWIGIL